MKPSRRLFLKGASALGFAAVTGTQPLLAAQADGLVVGTPIIPIFGI